MKSTWGVWGLLASVACGGAEAAPEAPTQHVPSAEEQAAQQANAYNARMAASAQAMQAKAVADAEAVQASIESQRKQKTQEHKAAREEKCAKTRDERVAEAKAAALTWKDLLSRVVPALPWAKANCVTKDTTGTKVSVEPTQGGKIVRLQRVGDPADLICKGKPPGGKVTISEIKWTREVMTEAADLPIVNVQPDREGVWSMENRQCTEQDKAALGYDLNIALKDGDAQVRILK